MLLATPINRLFPQPYFLIHLNWTHFKLLVQYSGFKEFYILLP